MIRRVIDWSLHNRFLVLLATAFLVAWGLYALARTPVDAIPDLSDVQVIIKTSYPGQAPQVVEDQVTYPLTTTLLSVPGATTVRGYSMFGDSYIYVLFQDGTDPYWARSRVLEYLNQTQGRLPEGVVPTLGPDATGVGWIYEYALVDRSGRHDLAQLRSLQDWFLKFELQRLPGVAEVATVGGMVKQYQVVVDPNRLLAYNITLAQVKDAIQRANSETGGSVIEMAEREYMVRVRGYIRSLNDLREVPLTVTQGGTPVTLGDVANLRLGPELRRGIAELNGQGEVVGGIIVMRYGENAQATIARVKARLAELKSSLPAGVEIVPTYDRSTLIERAVDNLKSKLLDESLVVALVVLLFLFHLRSSLVAIISLPVGILAAFTVMHYQGINANIMSLGGIAIAIGAMVDAAIVMIENMHKHLERAGPEADRWVIVRESAQEVGPALFFSLLIITVSFLPIFTLESQEGRLFSPLAFTKSYAMAAAAGLSVTLVPVLMGYFIRGRILPEHKNPLNRLLIAAYQPIINGVLRLRWLTILLAVLLLASAWYPLSRLGSEFMPPLNEGDFLYMPTTLPSISIGEASFILQQTDKLIASVPEVARVFGKAGRAETATDPAPLSMFETTIQLKPESQWRAGMTIEKIKDELNRVVQFPGLANSWTMPIRTRIDMLATGIKTPIGIKIAGPDLQGIQRVGAQIEAVMKQQPGTVSAFAERVTGGRYIDIDIDRVAAARYGLNVADVQDMVRAAIGGENATRTVEGRERYPVNLRYPRALRQSLADLSASRVATPSGAQIPLGEVAKIRLVDGPSEIKSENARLNGWVYVDVGKVDIGGYVARAKQAVAQEVKLPPGYSLIWSGQYEYMERAKARLQTVIPLTLALILLLLYFNFRNVTEVLMIVLSLPFALVGGIWILYLLGYQLSVAVVVGFIALAGVAAEFGVVMLLYLDQALKRYQAEGRMNNRADLKAAIIEGAVLRVRPKMMTVAVIVAGLLPIMFSHGTGSEVMQRIAAPMIGGMITAPLLSLLVIPALYAMWKQRQLKLPDGPASMPRSQSAI
ncbi:efflux RND transporter permease subunit [Thermithiobacillus plumbiphilus]|uniref:Efflux RND transporter permease subunit n=1 Tax=Thermithiobacillus plumbiphilus TaxID=1729899 RepID=A0ABU9D6E0_9PROT